MIELSPLSPLSPQYPEDVPRHILLVVTGMSPRIWSGLYHDLLFHCQSNVIEVNRSSYESGCQVVHQRP